MTKMSNYSVTSKEKTFFLSLCSDVGGLVKNLGSFEVKGDSKEIVWYKKHPYYVLPNPVLFLFDDKGVFGHGRVIRD